MQSREKIIQILIGHIIVKCHRNCLLDDVDLVFVFFFSTYFIHTVSIENVLIFESDCLPSGWQWLLLWLLFVSFFFFGGAHIVVGFADVAFVVVAIIGVWMRHNYDRVGVGVCVQYTA